MKNPPAIPSVPADFGLTKNKDYTPQQLTFLEELCNPANQGNIRTAMDAAGYSKNTKPHMIMANLKEEIIYGSKLLLTNVGIETTRQASDQRKGKLFCVCCLLILCG